MLLKQAGLVGAFLMMPVFAQANRFPSSSSAPEARSPRR